MTQTRVILFDIGKVLIGWNQQRLIDKVLEVSGVPDTAVTRTLFIGWQDAWDKGSMRELSTEQMRDYPDLAPAIRAYCDHWTLSLDPVIEESFDIAEALKRTGYRLLTASNFAADTFAASRPHMPRLDLFDALYISGHTGICKPSPDFWLDMMQRFDFKAEEALFIDDRPANTHTASELGLTTHLFETPEKLRADLQTHGIL